jgi:hypothetical protein
MADWEEEARPYGGLGEEARPDDRLGQGNQGRDRAWRWRRTRGGACPGAGGEAAEEGSSRPAEGREDNKASVREAGASEHELPFHRR